MSSLSKLLGALLALTVVVSIGAPIVGVGSFHAADMMGTMPPWSEEVPYDFRHDNGHVSDTVNAVVPMRASFRDRVWAGDLPTWNPLLGAGEPLAVVPNVGTFSPLTVGYLVAPLWLAPVITKLLEVVVAVVGMYLLVRRWGLGRPAALFGALAFVNSAFLVVWTNWPQSHVGALVPLVFWAVERGVTAPRLRQVWPLAAVVAVMWLEGFPAVTAYTLLTAGAYAVVRVVAEHGRGRAAWARLGALGGAVVLSVGIAALQLLPFLQFLLGLELGYREGIAGQPLDWSFLSTLAVPDALGNPVDRVFYGPRNYVEGQSWVGVVVLVLVGASVSLRRRVALPRGVLGFLAGAITVAVATVYFGTVTLDLLAEVPLLGSNFIGRYRAVLGMLVAAVAAVGYDVVVGAEPDRPATRKTALTLAVVGALLVPAAVAALSASIEVDQVPYAALQAVLPLVVAVLAVGLVLGHLRGRPLGSGFVLALAGGAAVLLGAVVAAGVLLGVDRELISLGLRSIAVGVVTGTVAVAALLVLAARRGRSSGLPLVALALPLLLAAEAVAFAQPWWARTPTELFYPPTAAHAYLADRLGPDRFAAAGSTLYPGTNAVYGLRSVTAHAFLPPTYREYLRAIEPDALARSTTFPFLSNDPATATSPLLDRAAARYWAVGPLDPVLGTTESVVAGEDRLVLDGSTELVAPLPAGTLRGVTFAHLASEGLAGEPAVIAAVRPAGGGPPIVTGRTRLHRWVRPGPLPVALGEVDVPQGSELVVRLEGAEEGAVVLGGAGQLPAYDRTTPADDGLRLVHTEGAVLYERTEALPRVRWAGRAAVAPSPEERLALLAGDLAPDVVVLGDGAVDEEASEAELVVREDSGDVMEVAVEAAGAGHVVVADGIQSGWRATLDGAPAPLVAADHAFAAVAVPAGGHVVRFEHDPPGWGLGRAITALSLLLLAALAVAERRTRPSDRAPAAHERA